MLAGLISAAQAARTNAYCPHSEYPVGAALRAADGTVFTGCNIENDNYTNTLHAEEVALAEGVKHGYREFTHLAVSTTSPDPSEPCGSCKQSLTQFCDESLVLVLDTEDEYVTRAFDPQFQLDE